MTNTPHPTPDRMPYVYDDGGRAAANGLPNRKKIADDCVARAIAIASGRPYAQVWLDLAKGQAQQRASKRTPKKGCTADKGINTSRRWFKAYMQSLGFVNVATMGIGTGCQVHLRPGELPMGRLVANVSKHYVAVIDGVIHDNHNPDRNGRRCVYSYWLLQEGRAAL